VKSEEEVPVVRKRKSIDQLYSEAKDYDLVLTTEPALSDGLVARLEEPVLGHFSITPRRLVYSEEGGENFRQEFFMKLVDEHGFSWKQASYLLQNVLDCWKKTGELEQVKNYDKFTGEEYETVFRLLEEEENPFKAMEQFEVDPEKEVAVIDIESFNELDKQVLPEEYDTIQLFTEEEHELSEFKIFESSGQLVQSLKENVERVGPGNTGVVMHPESPYQSLLKSLFDAENVPFVEEKDLSEDNDLRTLVNLVRIGLSRRNVRVKDVRPILEELDYTVSRGKDNRYVSDTEGLDQFKEFFNVLEYLEFQEVVGRYEKLTGNQMEKVRNLLKNLKLLDKTVSLEDLSNLEYYLDSFELKETESSEGVLLVDPRKVSLVDRPVVFFIGMDSSWTRETGRQDWIDKEKEEKKNLNGFTSLIQSGSQQVYMVQDMEMNQDITPCFHFNEALNTSFSNFRDLPCQRDTVRRKNWKEKGSTRSRPWLKPGK